MSFSKAKYERFNECENGVPPPGTYDPNFDVATKGFSIEKSARFQENKSTTGTELLLPACGKNSENLAATVLTPKVSRRSSLRKCSLSASKTKSRILNMDDKEKVKSELKTKLENLQLECENKNTTINEHEKVIENLKEELRKSDEQLQELFRRQTAMEDQHKRDIESMAQLQQQSLRDHNEKRQAELEIVRRQLLEVSAEKEGEFERRKIMEEELRSQIAELSKKVKSLESEIANGTEIHGDKVYSLEMQIEELTIMSKKLNEEHQVKVSLLEEEKSQFSVHVNNLTEERAKLLGELEKRENMILQLQGQLSVLQSELDKVKAEFEKSVEDSAKEMHSCVIRHREEIDKLKINFEKEKNTVLNEKQLEVSCRLEAERLSNDLMIAKDKEIAELTQAFAQKIEEEAARMKEHSDKITEDAKADAVAVALKDHTAKFEEYMKKVITKKAAHMNVMTQAVRNAVTEMIHLNIERYKACLTQLETEHAALDEKVALKDAEITKLLNTLPRLMGNENFGESLQIERDRIEAELVEKKNELMGLRDEIRAEAEETVDTRKRIEMIIAESQVLVSDLSERIVENTAGAEELSKLEEHDDACVREHMDLLNTMRSSTVIAHEQVLVLMEQMDAKKRLIDQFETRNSINQESMKSMYVTAIEDLLREMEGVVIRLRKDHDDNNERNEERDLELNEMRRRLKEAENTTFELREKNNILSLEISQVELLQSQLAERLNINDKLTEENKKLLDAQSADATDQDETDRFENERSKLETFTKAILAELEKEKTRREAAEGEVQKLTEHNERLTKDYQEMSEKYADLVGHQNLKQKIKHVSQLKDKISQLEQESQVMKKMIEKQQKTIDKLKEEKLMSFKGK